jgi:hypothetical protein
MSSDQRVWRPVATGRSDAMRTLLIILLILLLLGGLGFGVRGRR